MPKGPEVGSSLVVLRNMKSQCGSSESSRKGEHVDRKREDQDRGKELGFHSA